jgi:hypothetical protein
MELSETGPDGGPVSDIAGTPMAWVLAGQVRLVHLEQVGRTRSRCFGFASGLSGECR